MVYELWLLRVLLKMKIVCHVGIPRIGRGVQWDHRFLSVSHQADTFFLSEDKTDLVCRVLRDVVRDVWICYGELPWKFLLPKIFFFQVMKTNGKVFAYPSHSPGSALCKAHTLTYLPRYRNGSNREFLHCYRILTCFIRCSAKVLCRLSRWVCAQFA